MDNKVTTIITTYKRPVFLRRAMLSALNQTYKNVLVSVFDDASGDNTEAVVNAMKEKDDRIIYYCHPINLGVSPNVKYAFESITTPYFSLLSDDEVLAFDFYESAIKILDENPDIMFVIQKLLDIDENENLSGDDVGVSALTFYRGDDRLHCPIGLSAPTAYVFRKEVAKIYSEMDYRYDMAPDMRFLGLARARYNFAYIPKVGGFFTCHADSFSSKRKRFDVVHYAVQLSRYIEIFYDKNMSEQYRNYAFNSIRAMLKPSLKNGYRAFIETFKIVIKRICDGQQISNEILDAESKAAINARFYFSALLFKLARYQVIRTIIKFIFSSYHLKRMQKHRDRMCSLQNGIYKPYFDELKSIGE